LAAPIFPEATRREARQRFAQPLDALLSLAAVRSGAARWQHSWSGPARLVDHHGVELDLTGIAELAADPATVDEARRRLAEQGIDVSAAKHVEQRASAERAGILGGIVNLVVGKQRTDVLILSNGLMLLPGVPRLKMSGAKRRLAEWIELGDPRYPAAEEGSRFVAYEEIATVELARKFPVKYELTLHGGEQLVLRWGTESEELGDSSTLLARALASASTAA
ncbi:MAG TPA: HtpX-like protease, partial [Micromonospora sp.]